MNSISDTIDTLKRLAIPSTTSPARIISVDTRFIAPTLHIDVVSASFNDLELDNRLALLQRWIDDSGSAGAQVNVESVMARLPVTINALTTAEANERRQWTNAARGNSWVSSFLNEPSSDVPHGSSCVTKYVHFYGYKGGQARSTVLAMLAKSLSDDGYKVLVLDADIEAPSLDLFFGVSADSFSQSIMGLCGWADSIQPVAGVHAGSSGGRVDLLPCRPRIPQCDLDFALLAAVAPLDPRIYERAADRLDKHLRSIPDPYDAVIIDHRTGIASSVLPLVHRLRGTAAIFARSDANTAAVPSELRRVVRAIFEASAPTPGVFVSFSLDPNRSAINAPSSVEARTRESLLFELADAIDSTSKNHNTEFAPNDLSLNWIDWYLDRSLMGASLPEVAKLQSDNIASLGLLREALGLPIGQRKARSRGDVAVLKSMTYSLSGARDAGQFIHIPEIESLFVQGNPYTYILGRKGTGKTRLLREMASRNLGTPLLVAADEGGTGALRSHSIQATTWLERCRHDAPIFWWSLLRLAIEAEQTSGSIEQLIETRLNDNAEPLQFTDRLNMRSLVAASESKRVYLVDGLETLVRASRIKEFVAALFDLMGTVQNDPVLSTRLTIRSFVREDLATDAVQNVEQQMEGRSLRLKWSARSILNFAVSRLPSLTWINQTFAEVCDDIQGISTKVAKSELSEQEATAILLRIFPERLRRNNLFTATFLRLYFSDAGGDNTNKATFYPRLYLSFLQRLDKLASEAERPLDESTRIDSTLLNRAYDEASSEFITETKQELTHLLALEYEDKDAHREEDDQTRVSKFIEAFAGLSTPFQQEAIVGELHSRTNFTEKSVRESLQRMKAIRMFEDRPGYAGWWRVGQLYKMGLVMKYVRG